MQNPFSLSFGKEPSSMIGRGRQSMEIIDGFSGDNPAYQVCMITGVRGSGKTVLLSEIANEFREREDWIVVDLSPERDLLQSLAAELCNNESLFGLFQDAKKNKKVLITIDEATCNQTMKEFVSMFQIYMRRDLPVFLLMTGLYENIYELQNEKTLTFLYRAPKVALKPLNINMVAQKYKEVFALSDDESIKMAHETFGYPFAFQVLGYLCYKHNARYTDVIPEYSQYLEEYGYLSFTLPRFREFVVHMYINLD